MRTIFCLLALVSPAAAEDWYGTAKMSNHLGRPFRYTLEVSGQPREFQVMGPGQAKVFWHRYDFADEGRSPNLIIRYTVDGWEKVRRLKRCSVETQDGDTFDYVVRWDTNGSIEIYSTGDGGQVDYIKG